MFNYFKLGSDAEFAFIYYFAIFTLNIQNIQNIYAWANSEHPDKMLFYQGLQYLLLNLYIYKTHIRIFGQ